jgi:hypothetical protein
MSTGEASSVAIMSALDSKADMCSATRYVRFNPERGLPGAKDLICCREACAKTSRKACDDAALIVRNHCEKLCEFICCTAERADEDSCGRFAFLESPPDDSSEMKERTPCQNFER